MKTILTFLLIVFAYSSYAEESKVVDPFDLSDSESKVKELGVITKPEVDALEVKVKQFFNEGDCETAIPALIEYAKKANWLANMISANLDPYYGASYDDRKAYPYSKLRPLIPLETLANTYKKKRNIAFAMQGECLIKTGDEKGAIPVLLKTLDLLHVNSDSWWKRTRNNLLTIIKVPAN